MHRKAPAGQETFDSEFEQGGFAEARNRSRRRPGERAYSGEPCRMRMNCNPDCNPRRCTHLPATSFNAAWPLVGVIAGRRAMWPSAAAEHAFSGGAVSGGGEVPAGCFAHPR
jgi:hypothetical protein